MAKAVDKQTMELIEKVKAKKAEIRRIERPSWKTNCSFSYNEDQKSGAINIHVVADVSKLIRIAAFLLHASNTFRAAAEEIGVTPVPTFQWDGNRVEDWLFDLAMRVSQIQLQAKKEALDALETRLNAIISPELKRQMELDAIAAEVG